MKKAGSPFHPSSFIPHPFLPLLHAGARLQRPADAERLRMAGDLVGERLEVLHRSIEPRQDAGHHDRRVVQVVVKLRVGDQLLHRAVVAADGLEQLSRLDHRLVELDRRLVAATRGIRLLQSVSWPASIEMDFVAAWKTGTARLPEIVYPRFDFAETREAIKGSRKRLRSLQSEDDHCLGCNWKRGANPKINRHAAHTY